MIEQVVSYREKCCERERGGEREGEREGEKGEEREGGGGGGGMCPGVSVELEKQGPQRAQLAPLADVVSPYTHTNLPAYPLRIWH